MYDNITNNISECIIVYRLNIMGWIDDDLPIQFELIGEKYSLTS